LKVLDKFEVMWFDLWPMSPTVLLAKLSRRRMIEVFVRHRYFYNQGNNTLATLSVIPIEKIAIIAASVKYLLGDHISSGVIYTAAGAYLVYRVLIRWGIGWLWHRSDGYDIESEWNKGKVPPSRVELINPEDIALAIEERRRKPVFEEYSLPFNVQSAINENFWDLAENGMAAKKSKKPDYVHPDDGWRPEPNSGPREKIE
jgi:hypothetical protein